MQRRRQENEWRLAASRISQDDPAEKDESLKKKLEENREKAFRKESDLLNKYVNVFYLFHYAIKTIVSFNCDTKSTLNSAYFKITGIHRVIM